MGKGDNISFDFGALKSDIKKYVNKVLSTAAGVIRDELTDEAMLSMGAFYSHYTPKYYERHYYNFMNQSYRKYYSNPHNTIFRGGVELTPDALDDIYGSKHYPESPSEVFSFVYAGLHGPASIYNGVPAMKKSPMEMLLEKRDDIESNIEKYIDIGRAKAKSDSYTYLTFE